MKHQRSACVWCLAAAHTQQQDTFGQTGMWWCSSKRCVCGRSANMGNSKYVEYGRARVSCSNVLPMNAWLSL